MRAPGVWRELRSELQVLHAQCLVFQRRARVSHRGVPRVFVSALAFWRRIQVVPRRVRGRHAASAAFLHALELLLKQRTPSPVDLKCGPHRPQVINRPLFHAPHLFLHQLIHIRSPPLGKHIRVRQRVDVEVLPPPERGRDGRPAVQKHRRRHCRTRATGMTSTGRNLNLTMKLETGRLLRCSVQPSGRRVSQAATSPPRDHGKETRRQPNRNVYEIHGLSYKRHRSGVARTLRRRSSSRSESLGRPGPCLALPPIKTSSKGVGSPASPADSVARQKCCKVPQQQSPLSSNTTYTKVSSPHSAPIVS